MEPSKDFRERRAFSIILWVLQVIAALFFLLAAAGKFTGAPMSVASFDALGAGSWLMYVVAVLEVLASIALFVPRLCGLAALGLTLLMIGAVLTQLFAVGSGWELPLGLLIVVAIIAWGRWPRTARLQDLLPGAGSSHSAP